jgi:hypothetical protein
MVAIFPPMYAARSVVAGTLQRRVLAPAFGQNKMLENVGRAGSQVLDLSNATGLALGGLIRIDAQPPEQTEIIEVITLGGGSTSNQPTRITTRFPLAFDHPRGAVVRPVTPQAPGSSKSFTREAYAGDSTLYLNDLSSLASGVFVEIAGDGLPPEYHSIFLYSTVSGSDGFFRLPPLHRAAQVTLNASSPPLADVNLIFSPDYRQVENRVDVVFRP